MVFCLLSLFILTFWGTVYQVYYGLYPAQQKFFQSFFFFILGFIPFPGAQLVMWVMFINLIFVALFRFIYQWDRIGIMIIHIGLLLFLISAFVTFHCIQESSLSLVEEEGSNVASAYHDWELAVWKETDGLKRKIIAYDAARFVAGQTLDFNEYGFNLSIKSYYANCKAYAASERMAINTIINASGIVSLTAIPGDHDPAKNAPGIVFLLKQKSNPEKEILLYGGESAPTRLTVNKETYYFILRHKRFPLPFTLKLLEFRMKKHPGTEVARSFESTVEIETPAMSRQTVISMNNPLRYRNYTFYQASYGTDAQGRQFSTLAVVRNSGRLLPYISCIVTFAGLLMHFLLSFRKTLLEKAEAV